MIDETELESAKSSHVYSVVRSMGTNLEAAKMAYVNEFLKDLPKDYPLQLLKKITEVQCLYDLSNLSRRLQFRIARGSWTLI